LRIVDLEAVASSESSSRSVKRLEARVDELVAALDRETREKTDITTAARKTDRMIRDLQAQVNDRDKTKQRMEEDTQKLNEKLKKMKAQVEDLVSRLTWEMLM
jgi:myosin protein heavy chain